jgi:two-component system LytT family response regulator
MSAKLRVVIADDERPARVFLAGLLRSYDDVELVGEAASGPEAVMVIERERPDLALLDLEMPEVDGLGVVRLLKAEHIPLFAFVTAYDEYAVQAFELSAIDYLLKPVQPARLRRTINRAQAQLEQADYDPADALPRLRAALGEHGIGGTEGHLRRIPVRKREAIVIVPVDQIASIVADGPHLHLTMGTGDRHTITFRLKDLEKRLDPAQFVRLSRGAIANLDMIARVSPMPGGRYAVTLTNRQELSVSRTRGSSVRELLLRL